MFGLRYQTSGYKVLDNRRMIQIIVPAEPAGFLNAKNDDHRLVMIHFHTLAETAMDDNPAPTGIHVIHQHANKQRTIIVVNIIEGKTNPTVKQRLKHRPKEKGEETTLAGNFPAQLLPKNRRYFYCMGSITIPPCPKQAQWIVLQKPIALSTTQVQEFGQRYQQPIWPGQSL